MLITLSIDVIKHGWYPKPSWHGIGRPRNSPCPCHEEPPIKAGRVRTVQPAGSPVLNSKSHVVKGHPCWRLRVQIATQPRGIFSCSSDHQMRARLCLDLPGTPRHLPNHPTNTGMQVQRELPMSHILFCSVSVWSTGVLKHHASGKKLKTVRGEVRKKNS